MFQPQMLFAVGRAPSVVTRALRCRLNVLPRTSPRLHTVLRSADYRNRPRKAAIGENA